MTTINLDDRPRSVADQFAEWLYGDDPVTDPQVRADLEREYIERAGDWDFQARPEQLPPEGDWSVWPYVAGRGAGKTRSGAEATLDRAEDYADVGYGMRGALVARTAADVRDVMVEGESGLMACAERRQVRARYQPGKRLVTLPDLDCQLHAYSAMEPNSLRGPQHHWAWADEPGAWRHIVDDKGNTAWTNLMFGLRLDVPGLMPRAMATTTPKPIGVIREWFDADEAGDHRVAMTKGSLYDNLANLAPTFVADIVERYRDSPLAGQEIFGLLVLAVEGALWTPDRIEASRVADVPPLGRRITAVDPPSETQAECGIVTMGLAADRDVYVTGDYSLRGRSDVWAAECVRAYHESLSQIMVVERNHGGDMIRGLVHMVDPNVNVEKVTAIHSKWVRAEPVAAAWRRVHHHATFPMLEAQMCTWTEDDAESPDRMDAYVHGVRHLLPEIIAPPTRVTSAAGRSFHDRA